MRRAITFLGDGDRVKVTVQFRGREVSHAYIGRDLLDRFATSVAEYGTVDRPPILEGRSMTMVLTSTNKPGAQPRKSDGEPQTETTMQAAPANPAPRLAVDEPEAPTATSTGG